MKKLACVLLFAGLLAVAAWIGMTILCNDRAARSATPPAMTVAFHSTISADSGVPKARREIGHADPVVTAGGFEGLLVCVVDDITGAPVSAAQVFLSDTLELWGALNANGTTVNTPAGRRIRRQLQQEVMTDVGGSAAFATCPEHCTVEARAGDRWGNATLNEVPVNHRVTVRLTEDTAVSVRVESPAGIPRSGVPVALRRPTTAYPPFQWSLTETEGPDGVATFEHHQLRLKRGEGWRFAFGFPVIDDPTAAVDAAAAREELPVLVLEGAGQLLIRVRDAQGNPPHGSELTVRLSAFDDARGGAELSPGGPWSAMPLTQDGEARVPWIGLGLRLRVEVLQQEARRGEAVVIGPSRDNDLVECEVAVDEPRLLCGRLVFRDGSPWVSQSIAAIVAPVLRRSAGESSYSVETDPAGRFAFPITEGPSSDTPCIFRLAGIHPRTHECATASITLWNTPPPGGLDLGDVILDHGQLLLAGHVIDVNGTPIHYATFALHLADEPGSAASTHGGETMSLSVAPGAHSAADGSFALFARTDETGHAPETLLSLTTRHPDFATEEAQPVRLGQSQVEVLLAPAGSIEGTLNLCEGIGIADVELVLTSDAGRLYALEPRAKQFRFRSLAEGTYLLQVRPLVARYAPDARALVEIPGLEVRAGTVCQDPRLQPLRVEDGRTPATVRVINDSSTPIPDAWVVARGAIYYRAPPQTNDDGLCVLRLDSIPVEAEVGAVGFRKQFVSIGAGETCVVLQPGVMTRFYTNAEVAGSDPSYRLYVQLFEVDASGMRGAPAIRMGPHALDVLQSGLGGAPVALSPGTYECAPRIKVFRPDRPVEGQVTLVSYPRFTVRESHEEQRCEIDIPQAEVVAAVAQYNSM